MTESTPLPFPARVSEWPADTAPLPAASLPFLEMIRRASLLASVAPQLLCAVCEQESGWNPWAMRFEPAFLVKYVDPKLSDETERMARATSWGLMQVMGQTARGFGFAGKYLCQMCEPYVGLYWGARVLASKLAKAEGLTQNALLLWNGGGNQDYPAEVLARMDKYA